MQMSDDEEARFAAVRVSYQRGHIPCRSARFTSSCARETYQQSSRKSSVPSDPAKQVQVFRKKSRSHVRENNPLRETINVSLARFTNRCKVLLPVTFFEFPQELRIRDTIHISFGTFHQWLDRERPSCPETFCQKISGCHELCVLALHGVVPRLAVCLHSLLSEECLYLDLHVFRRSSREVCSSRSMAAGGDRPYLRSASV